MKKRKKRKSMKRKSIKRKRRRKMKNDEKKKKKKKRKTYKCMGTGAETGRGRCGVYRRGQKERNRGGVNDGDREGGEVDRVLRR
jgi:hypothetical protein